jgi:hypothetical protein
MILPAALAAPAFAQPVSGAVKVGFADTRSEIDRDRIVVLGWSDGGNALLAALKHIEHEGEKAMAARACNGIGPMWCVECDRSVSSDPDRVQSTKWFATLPAQSKQHRSSQCHHKSCCRRWTLKTCYQNWT